MRRRLISAQGEFCGIANISTWVLSYILFGNISFPVLLRPPIVDLSEVRDDDLAAEVSFVKFSSQ